VDAKGKLPREQRDRLHALWKTGLPPSEGLERFGPLLLVNELRDSFEQHSDKDRFAEMLLQQRAAGHEFGANPEDFQYALQRQARQQAAVCALEADILRQLEQRVLVVLGFWVSAETAENAPVEVPLYMFDRRPNWSRSDTIEANGRRYESVRIAPSDPKADRASRRPGRPSRADQIFAAWDRLVAEDRILVRKSLASHFPLVRETVAIMFPNDPSGEEGMKDKTLHVILGPSFKELRRAAGI
jgi:hypothetical protein